jgi:outer membrane lipoprotein-sorting protein
MLLIFTLLSLFAAAPKEAIKTPEALIQAMHDRYAATWYKTATFVQKTTNYDADGTSKSEIWYEAMSLPGKLRIDFDPINNGNGMLFVDDTVHRFQKGEEKQSRPLIHPLLVLGFDVYGQPVQATLAKLKQLGFDLSLLREDTWQGHPVYVVGAKADDLRAPQFWIDKEHFYFVRMIQPAGPDKSHTQESLFNKYQRLKGGWIATEVIFMLDGKMRTKEEYTDIRGDVELDPKLFDPANWRTARWR